MWEAFAVWLFFLVVVSHIFQVLKLLFNLLLGVAILMWLVVFNVLTLIINGIYNIFFPFRAAAYQALILLCKPFTAMEAFLGKLGTLTLIVLHLSLRALCYTVVLWLLIYMLNLLYHFVQHGDFAIQGELYFGPSPRRDHFGQGQQILIFAPVLLNQWH